VPRKNKKIKRDNALSVILAEMTLRRKRRNMGVSMDISKRIITCGIIFSISLT